MAIPNVTEQEWAEVNKFNREIVEEFLENMQHLSPATLKQYESGLKIFMRYIKDYEDNVQITELKPRNALKYQNWLIKEGLSSNGIKFKRACINSLFQYLEVYYLDEFPHIRSIFSKAITAPPNSPVRKKEPLTVDELEKLIDTLTKREEWQYLAYLLVSYETGARREEVRQLKKEIAMYEKIDGKNFYASHAVRGKGRGVIGKTVYLYFGDEAMSAIRKWLEIRGDDDCPYLFVTKVGAQANRVSASTFNYWCSNIFSPILGGKAVFPHLLRSSRATNLVVEEGKDINAIKQLLHHESTETSEIYVVRDESEDLDDIFDP